MRELSVYRGDKEVIYSGVAFINDKEEYKIKFRLSKNKLASLTFIFSRGTVDNSQPTINVTKSDVSKSRFYKVVNFSGWDKPFAFSAIKPMKLFATATESFSFAVCNSYLNGTNMLRIEIYAEKKGSV